LQNQYSCGPSPRHSEKGAAHETGENAVYDPGGKASSSDGQARQGEGSCYLMSNEQIRSVVTSAYQGDAWRKKVKSMDDNQVLAIFKNLQKRKIIK